MTPEQEPAKTAGNRPRLKRTALGLLLVAMMIALSARPVGAALMRNRAMVLLSNTLLADVDSQTLATAARYMQTAEQWGGPSISVSSAWLQQFVGLATQAEANRAAATLLAGVSEQLADGEAVTDSTVEELTSAAAAGWTEAELLLALVRCGPTADCLDAVALSPIELLPSQQVEVDGWTLAGYQLRPTHLGNTPRLYILTFWQHNRLAQICKTSAVPAARHYCVDDVLMIAQEQENRLLNGDFAWAPSPGARPWAYSEMFCSEATQEKCKWEAFQVTEHNTLRIPPLEEEAMLYQYVDVSSAQPYILLGQLSGRAGFVGFREVDPEAGNRFTVIRGSCDDCAIQPAAILVRPDHTQGAYVYLGRAGNGPSTEANSSRFGAEFDDLVFIQLPPLPQVDTP